MLKIKSRYTCCSSYVVHTLECPYSMIYVGEMTTDICERINKHKSTIRKKIVDLPVPKLFID